MANSKVKDSITSLGYLATSEEEDLLTPPVSPVKKFIECFHCFPVLCHILIIVAGSVADPYLVPSTFLIPGSGIQVGQKIWVLDPGSAVDILGHIS
jgi:hypothetical protein